MTSLLEVFPLAPFGSEEFFGLLPLFILSITAVAGLIASPGLKGRRLGMIIAAIGVVISMAVTFQGIFDPAVNILDGTLLLDKFSKFLSLVLHACALLGIFVTYGYDEAENILSEIYALLVFALAGMVLMVSTTHLAFMFIALEIMSLSIYVIVAMKRTSRFSSEAGLKYFILGGLASAFFLYGAALLFGSQGTFVLSKMVASSAGYSPIFYVGTLFVLIGLLFKVGAFPFHSWIPDVYQGATTSVTGFMGAAVKLTAFVALIRVTQFLVFIPDFTQTLIFQSLLAVVATMTMVYGNFVALQQSELKRMLAYSTIAHTGYLLVGLLSLSTTSLNAYSLVVYLTLYAFANIGIFALIIMLETRGSKDVVIEELSGLWKSSPLIAIAMSVFLLAMAGIPLTSGFVGKYLLFSKAVSSNFVPLVVIAVLTSVVSVYYYLRVIVLMFMKDQVGERKVNASLWSGCLVTAVICLILTVDLGIFPSGFIDFVSMLLH